MSSDFHAGDPRVVQRDADAFDPHIAEFSPRLVSQPNATFSGDDFWLHINETGDLALSAAASAWLGRPVAVAGLGGLPFSELTTPSATASFTRHQQDARTDHLDRLVSAVMPSVFAPVRASFALAELAACDRPAARCHHGNNPAAASRLPARMIGDLWKDAVVILAPNDRWSNRDEWAHLTGIDAAVLDHAPRGAGIKQFLFLRQIVGVLQLCYRADAAPSWIETYDSDRGAFQIMEDYAHRPQTSAALRAELLDTVEAVKHARILHDFTGLSPDYWGDPSLVPPSAGKDRLRTFVVDTARALLPPGFVPDGDRLSEYIAELAWVFDEGRPADPMAVSHAAKLLQAVDYFCPDLLSAGVRKSAIRATAPEQLPALHRNEPATLTL